MRRLGRLVLFVLLAVLVLCIMVTGLSALANRNLPTHSQVVERLSEAEKARLEEMFHLRQALGDAVWPGWGQASIPLIVHNEAYAFLLGYPDPPPGWIKVPNYRQEGQAWERVPDDTFLGQPYYRQPLSDPATTPENFTVLVGDRWVATLQTKEYAAVAFYRGFREQLPPLVRSIFPYRLVWSFLGGDTEVHIGALAHEAFHAYQGTVAEQRLSQAELVNRLGAAYPWDSQASEQAWQAELDALVAAARAETAGEAAELARQFLALRSQRRSQQGLSSELIDFERQREWLEGLAKYAELELIRQAAATPGYEPLPGMADDPDFEGYASGERYWQQQLGEANRLTGRDPHTRFYYSGLDQATLLDQLAPGWKAQAFQEGVFLEDLLQQALGSQP